MRFTWWLALLVLQSVVRADVSKTSGRSPKVPEYTSHDPAPIDEYSPIEQRYMVQAESRSDKNYAEAAASVIPQVVESYRQVYERSGYGGYGSAPAKYVVTFKDDGKKGKGSKGGKKGPSKYIVHYDHHQKGYGHGYGGYGHDIGYGGYGGHDHYGQGYGYGGGHGHGGGGKGKTKYYSKSKGGKGGKKGGGGGGYGGYGGGYGGGHGGHGGYGGYGGGYGGYGHDNYHNEGKQKYKHKSKGDGWKTFFKSFYKGDKGKGGKKGNDVQEVYVKAIHPKPVQYVEQVYSAGYGHDFGGHDLGGYGHHDVIHRRDSPIDTLSSLDALDTLDPLASTALIHDDSSLIGYPTSPIERRGTRQKRDTTDLAEAESKVSHKSPSFYGHNLVHEGHDFFHNQHHHKHKDFFSPSPYKGPKLGPYDLVAGKNGKLTKAGKIGNDPVYESKKNGFKHSIYDKPIAHFGGFGGGGDRYGPGLKGYSYLVDHIEGPKPKKTHNKVHFTGYHDLKPYPHHGLGHGHHGGGSIGHGHHKGGGVEYSHHGSGVKWKRDSVHRPSYQPEFHTAKPTDYKYVTYKNRVDDFGLLKDQTAMKNTRPYDIKVRKELTKNHRFNDANSNNERRNLGSKKMVGKNSAVPPVYVAKP